MLLNSAFAHAFHICLLPLLIFSVIHDLATLASYLTLVSRLQVWLFIRIKLHNVDIAFPCKA